MDGGGKSRLTQACLHHIKHKYALTACYRWQMVKRFNQETMEAVIILWWSWNP
jgi:hypothetical protein